MGFNFRMTDIQCAVGLVQLGKLDEIRSRKLAILDWYEEGLADISQVAFFTPDPGAEWIPFRAGILCDDAHDLMDYMRDNAIEPRTFFYPLHKQPALAKLLREGDAPAPQDADFPNAMAAYDRGICLPTFATLTREQVGHVCDVIGRYFAQK